jgi:hypothetical protein
MQAPFDGVPACVLFWVPVFLEYSYSHFKLFYLIK